MSKLLFQQFLLVSSEFFNEISLDFVKKPAKSAFLPILLTLEFFQLL